MNRMSFKSKLAEFAVVYDLIPIRLKWMKSVSAVGRMFSDVFYILDEDDRAKLAKMMYSWGIEDAKEIVETSKVEKDIHGCSIALMGVHRLFGVKSHIAFESETEIRIHATHCLWKDKKGWTPEVCAAIDNYERGIVEGMNKKIKHYYTQRRSQGGKFKFCEMVLKY